jgi:cysteine sulfinate desulfinase/cysteine desulfurase-like protein
VLRAMGLTDALAQSATRFSFGSSTSDADIDLAVEGYRRAIAHLRGLAPQTGGRRALS